MKLDRLRFLTILGLASIVFFDLTGIAYADYTVTGNFYYQHRDFDIYGFNGITTTRPIRSADVEVWAATGSPTQPLTTSRVSTDANGNFSITVPGDTQQQIKIRCYAASTSIPGLFLEIRSNSGQSSSFTDPQGALWYFDTQAIRYSGGVLPPVSTVINYNDPSVGSLFNLWDAMVNGAQFVEAVTGSLPSEKMIGVWSNGYTNYRSYYASPSGMSSLTKKYFFIGNGYDDSVIYHQVGHFIADAYSKLDAPVAVLGSDGYLHYPAFGDGNQDIRVAWAEGVAMFLGASIRQYKGDPTATTYLMTNGTNPVLSFELQNLNQPVYLLPFFNQPFASTSGDTNMLAVASALWNITNGAALHRPFADVWNVLTAMKPIAAAGISTESFWETWFSPAVNNGSLEALQSVFSARGIEFFADALEADDSPAAAALGTAAQIQLASGPKVVLSEIQIGSVNAIELFNAGDTIADLTGWTIVAGRQGFAPAKFTLPAFQLKPGTFVVLSGSSGINTNSTLYFPVAIPWAIGGDGACAVWSNSIPQVQKDFVRWGNSAEIPASAWTGPNPASPSFGLDLARSFGRTEASAGSAWNAQTPSLGTFNVSGLEKHHTFYPMNDADYTSVRVTGGRTYIFEVLNLANGADTTLDLIAPDGATVIATSDDFGPGKASRIFWRAASGADGDYYLLCRRYSGPLNQARYGSYDLRMIESSSALGDAGSNILTVSKPGNGGKYQTIGDAVMAAGNEDMVQIIDSEIYNENLSLSGKSITIKGSGRFPTLEGGAPGRQ